MGLPKTKNFSTLTKAFQWVGTLVRAGFKAEMNKIMADRFEQYRPKDPIALLLGVERKADRICKKLMPGGSWNVEIDTDSFSTWYNRFLPYAYAMMESEEGFECLGIDFDSINAYYRTVMGFVDLGQGDGFTENPPYNRIDPSDIDLFQEVYALSSQLWSPRLPFDEAYRPCCVFVGMQRPNLFVEHFRDYGGPNANMTKHLREVCKKMDKPVPKFKW